MLDHIFPNIPQQQHANSSHREPANLSLSAEKNKHLEIAVTFLQGEELESCSG